jgi:sugar lactone lactonase YvrE
MLRRGFVLLLVIGFLVQGWVTAQEAPDLDTEFTSSDGTLTFQHPSRWQVAELEHAPDDFFSYIYLGIYDQGDPYMIQSELAILNASNFEYIPADVPRLSDSVNGVLRYFVETSVRPDQFEEPQPISLDQFEASYVRTINEPAYSPLEYWIVMGLGSGNYLAWNVRCTVNNPDLCEPPMFAMLSTVQYKPNLVEAVTLPKPTAGEGPVLWQLDGLADYMPSSVAVDSHDTLYITAMVLNTALNVYSGGLIVIDATGQVQQVLALPELYPDGDLDPVGDDTFWSADMGDCELHHLDTAGTVLESIRLPSGNCHVHQVVIGPDGLFYTLHVPAMMGSSLPGTVIVASAAGEKLREFDVYEPGVFDFDTDLGMAGFSLAPDDRLYVINSFGPRLVRVFDLDGTLLNASFAPEIDHPVNVYAAPDGMIYILGGENYLYRFTPEGEQFDSILLPGSFYGTQPMAQLSDGSLVVLSRGGSVVRVQFE